MVNYFIFVTCKAKIGIYAFHYTKELVPSLFYL